MGAVTTDGFVTTDNLKAILFSGSFVGIAAIGTMTIMLSGNLFSLSLGTSISVAAIAFLAALHFGLAVAIVLVLALGMAMFAIQGAIIGLFEANAIIVTIAAGAVQSGVVTWLTAGANQVPSGSSTAYEQLGGELLGIPFGFYVLVVLAVVVSLLLNRTPFGRMTFLMGENRRAAHAAGLPVAWITTGAFAIAGADGRRGRHPPGRVQRHRDDVNRRVLHLRRDRRHARRRQRDRGRQGLGRARVLRRVLHRDGDRHPAAARLLPRRPDPRRGHRCRGHCRAAAHLRAAVAMKRIRASGDTLTYLRVRRRGAGAVAAAGVLERLG